MSAKANHEKAAKGDFSALEAVFRRSINELAFNSKPIITQLTILAGNHSYGSHIISKIILDRLSDAPHKLRLPTLYLIDSICKNIGGPFIASLSQELVPKYIQATKGLDDKTKHDFDRVLQTWKAGHVFPSPILKELDTRIQFLSGRGPATGDFDLQNVEEQSTMAGHAGPPAYYSQPPPIQPPLGGYALSQPQILMAPSQLSFSTESPPGIHSINPPSLPPPSSLQQLLSSVGVLKDPAFLNIVSSRERDKESISYVPLTNEDIKSHHEGAVTCLYEKQPLQCKACALRFEESDEGRKRMADHLDWHFRRNRRLKERQKKPISRGYYLTEQQWLSSGSHGELFGEEKGASAFDDDDGDGEGIKSSTGESVHKKIKLEQPVSSASSSDVSVAIEEGEEEAKCAVCGEKFETYWGEDEEAWMFRNAVRDTLNQQQIYHGHCLRSSPQKSPL